MAPQGTLSRPGPSRFTLRRVDDDRRGAANDGRGAANSGKRMGMAFRSNSRLAWKHHRLAPALILATVFHRRRCFLLHSRNDSWCHFSAHPRSADPHDHFYNLAGLYDRGVLSFPSLCRSTRTLKRVLTVSETILGVFLVWRD